MPELEITVNDVRLAVETAGEGPGTVLFIHGFPLDRTIWAPQMAGLAGWQLVAPDLRGMGRSGAPSAGYSMAGYAADLRGLLDRLEIDQVVLCGLSMGGYVAFECLRQWRERVAGLILMDTRAEPDTPEGRSGRDAMIALAREEGAPAVAAAMLPRLLRPSIHVERPGLPEQVLGMMAGTPVDGLVGALEAIRDRPDSRPLLAALAGLPTLVVVGEDDVLMPPEGARAMAEAIPGAELEVVPMAAHLPILEQPALTTALLQRFLDRLGR